MDIEQLHDMLDAAHYVRVLLDPAAVVVWYGTRQILLFATDGTNYDVVSFMEDLNPSTIDKWCDDYVKKERGTE